MTMKRSTVFLAMVLMGAGFVSAADDEARLLRFPAIHGDTIVFSYAGDLYTVPAEGGVARRLTSHDGYEMFPRFSPDGETIAFTGQYDGNTEVFVIPAAGGEPKRLTWTATLGRDDVSDRMGPNNIVMGWKSDGSRIVFRSRMDSFNDFQGKLYTVSPEGGPLEELPLPRGGFCSFSPEDDKLAYNRVFREFRTWKRYRGGMADDVWIYDFNTKQIENITDNPALDLFPMWKGDKIYFVSDRDKNKRVNLYVYELDGKQTRQLTHFAEFDIKFPSLGDNAIVFENGGFIYRFDLEKEECAKVEIQIREDLLGGREGFVKVSGRITSADIAPDGKRALFGARGDVFTVPAKNGEIRNLTGTPGVHERNSVWSPDGKWIAFVSDATGEDEIYIVPQDGTGQAKQLTRNGDTYLYGIVWSPDSRKILWSDRRLRLRFVNVEDGGVTDVDQAVEWEFGAYVWSPDSQWIAFVRPETETMEKIYLFSLADRNSVALTDGWYGCDDPAFSSDGRYIFFVSNRDFDPIYGSTEWNHIYLDMSRIYFVTLAKDVPNPLAPQSDEVQLKKDDDKAKEEPAKDGDKPKEDADKKDKDKKEVEVRVDREGLSSRIVALPVPTSRYSRLASVGDTLYYTRHGSKEDKTRLFAYDLKERKETELGALDGYDISADHKKMLVRADGRYAIIDLPKGKFEMKDPLDLSDMEVRLDRRAEWKQIYWECWRQMRDFFYVPNLHGVDWMGLGRRYEALLPFVNHRADLTYIIGELIGELNAGHTYVGGGEFPHPARIPLGLLGAKLQRDDASGFWKITRILRGQNWDDKLRSPLTEVGVDARTDDFILSIDGRPANVDNIYTLLVNKAGKQVVLKLNAQPDDEGARTVTVVPVASEQKLYYLDWVQHNMEIVNKATDDKVGYIHVPDMSPEGLNEFVKYFYPQIHKKALIIDVRGNGGGNVSPMLIERLRRQAVMIDVARGGQPHPDPEAMIWGPMVCLCDEYSASDGDLFSYRFKQSKLGKLIGKRTWGGVVGIRGTLPLLDGGTLNKPEFSRYDLAGRKWIIEGRGVDPDITVDNDPAREYAGDDDQLNKAIEVILEELKTKEKTVPALPPYPVK
jgi:tricorn protease